VGIVITVQDSLARLRRVADNGSLASACLEIGVALLVVHGSVLTRPDRARDVDLAYAVLGEPASDELTLVNRFHELVPGDHLDLMDLGRADPVARLAALQRGELLHEAEPHLYAEQHLAAVGAYRDTQWMRDRALERL